MDECIKEEVINKMIDEYNELFINKNINIIDKLKFGFVSNDCSIPFISMLIHSIESIDIFRNEHLDKLSFILIQFKHE